MLQFHSVIKPIVLNSNRKKKKKDPIHLLKQISKAYQEIMDVKLRRQSETK